MPTPAGGRRGKGDLEAEVLAVLTAADAPLTPRDVVERLRQAPAYTTVMTVLVRLHEKGAVRRVRAGRAYAYSFLRDDASRRAAQMRHLLGEEGERAHVLARFVDELSPADERLLLRLLGQDDERG
ncbi:Penicillinase repressor [Actinomadura rubteroloni]|uniref:Penicillinase repressor n=1 Tax=Actinomadura rubteroloni TaxID=1926885 RepID=A0A2P4UM35_9ACTN|nr:BlaI/MecI/CopY family transcriptional regulator [Actinomadura rubteroloni]POM26111.1 Penicillinase repressor [Actinomadura rubteroloni]